MEGKSGRELEIKKKAVRHKETSIMEIKGAHKRGTWLQMQEMISQLID